MDDRPAPDKVVALAPAPWDLAGRGYIFAVWMPQDVLDHGSFIPPQTPRAGRGRVAFAMFVDYSSSDVGPYHELLYIPGKLRFGEDRRDARLSISRIFVSSQASVVNGRLNDLGFGARGYTGYDPSGRPVSVVENFTVGVALRQLAARAWDVASNTVTPFLLLPLLFVARLTGRRHDGRLVAAFAVLPALHAFYFFSETRFYLELFPFLYLAVAVLVADIRERREALARWLLTVGLVGNVVLTTLWLAIGVATFPARMSAFRAVERAAAANGRVLLFVADSTTESRGAFYSLYWYDVDRPVGRVVVARDLGTENARLTARLPDHVPFRLARSSDGEYRLAPLR